MRVLEDAGSSPRRRSESTGGFAPGASNETGDREIEIKVLTGGGNDHATVLDKDAGHDSIWIRRIPVPHAFGPEIDLNGDLAPLGRPDRHGRVIFSGRDGGVGDAGVERVFELAPGTAEGCVPGDRLGQGRVEFGE